MQKVIDFISLKLISPFKWDRIKFLLTGRYYNLTAEDRDRARVLMASGTFLWVSRRRTHLTSYLISFADWALSLSVWVKSRFKGPRPKWGYWTHAFLNLNPTRFIEAVAKGVQEAHFDEVLNVDAVAVLAPAFVSPQEWEELSGRVIEKAKAQLGKKYDTIFNIADEDQLSCIELMRVVLMEVPNYETKFRDFEETIKLYKNVTPEMLYRSKSFVVVWEVRR